jgi:glycosyltransferase involved in cell wall biosynthesis
MFDTLGMTPCSSGGVGSMARYLLPAYICAAHERKMKFGFLDNWEGARNWCASFQEYSYFYDLPLHYDEVAFHLVSAFRCAFRNSRSDIDRFRCRKVIVTHHDFIDLDYPWLFGQRELRLRKDAYRSFARYDGIVAPSRGVADRLRADFGIPISKIAVIAHGNDQFLSHSVATDSDVSNGRFILFVGKLYPHKNWERLLAACSAAREHLLRADTKLLFLTADYEAKRDVLEELNRSLELSGIVEFRGFASEDELAMLFRTASGFICPSLIEGFGMPLFEAQAFGVPLCVSDIPVFRDVLAISGRQAMLFDPRCVDSISQAISQFVTGKNEERPEPFIRSWKTVALEYSEFLEQVLHQTSH